MKITWEHSPETEALRIIHDAHQIGTGFFRLNGFYVLPEGYKTICSNSNIVRFPDIDVNSIPRFWEKCKRTNVYKLPIKADSGFVAKISELMGTIRKPDFIKTQDVWQKMEKEFFEAVGEVVPELKNAVEDITIYPTIYGTKCSFSVATQFPCSVKMYLREDEDMIYGLAEGILSALTRNAVYTKLEGNWGESEMLVDWLLTESKIGKVIEKYHNLNKFSPTMKSVRAKQNATLMKQSDDFCKRLGLPNFEKPFTINDNKPELWGKPIDNLSNQETSVLLTLLNRANEVVTVDEVAGIVFKDESEFSLYAISKKMQRLRDKLEAAGISGSYIQTQRGKGYVIRN